MLIESVAGVCAEGRKNVPTDYFEGVIERYDPANPEAEGQVVSNVEGSWVGYCDFDKVRYWDHRTTEKLAMSPPRNTLPSDSRRRADRNALEKKDFKLAQVPARAHAPFPGMWAKCC